MRKKPVIFISIVLIFLIILSGGLYYAAKTFLPAIVKEKLTSSLSGLTQGRVTINSVRLNLLKGVVIEGLTVSDKDDPAVILFKIKEASAGLFLLPLIKDQKIIIPELKLNSIEFNLARRKDNTLNISYIIDKFSQPQPGASKKIPSVLIMTVKLSDSNINFIDEAIDIPATASLKIPKLILRMGFKRMALEAKAELIKNNKTTSAMIKAVYTYNPERLSANISLDKIELNTFKEYLTGLALSSDSGQLNNIKADCILDGDSIMAEAGLNLTQISALYNEYAIKDATGNLSLSFKSQKDNLKDASYKGRLNLENALFDYDGVAKAKGVIERSYCEYLFEHGLLKLSVLLTSPEVNGQKDAIDFKKASLQANAVITIPIKPENDTKNTTSYEGTASVQCTELSGIPQVNKINDIAASLNFKTNNIIIDSLTAKLSGTEITGRATLKDNLLDADLEGDLDLEQVVGIFKQNFKFSAIEVSGTAETKLHISLDTSKQAPALLRGEAILQNMSFALPELELSLETDKGRIEFDTSSEILSWHFNAMKYLGKNYSFDGNLKNFKTPFIFAEITGEDINIKAQASVKDGVTKFSSGRGTYKNSAFEVLGEIDGKKTLDISGQIDLDLTDLKYLLPKSTATLEPMALKGRSLIQFTCKGPASDYKLLYIKADGRSKAISAYGLKFNNILLDYTQSNSEGFINSLSFDAYEGKANASGRIELLKNDLNYALRASLRNINIKQAILDSQIKDKNFSGILNGDVSVKGQAGDLKSMKGGGTLSIKDGNLWEFNPLKGLGNFLFIPRFSNITFTNANGDLYIQDGYVSTDNFELMGPELGLMVEGRITFDGTLDLLINTQIPISGKEEDQKIEEAVTTASNMTAIKITGTVKEPKYKLQPIGENIIRKFGEIFSNILP